MQDLERSDMSEWNMPTKKKVNKAIQEMTKKEESKLHWIQSLQFVTTMLLKFYFLHQSKCSGLSPGWGTKIPHAMQLGQRKRKTQTNIWIQDQFLFSLNQQNVQS